MQVYRERATMNPSDDTSFTSTTNPAPEDTASGTAATTRTAVDKIQDYIEHATSEDTSSTTNPASEGTASDTATTTNTDPSEDQTTESCRIVDTDLSQKVSLSKLM